VSLRRRRCGAQGCFCALCWPCSVASRFAVAALGDGFHCGGGDYENHPFVLFCSFLVGGLSGLGVYQ
jgi:hypothetical protein